MCVGVQHGGFGRLLEEEEYNMRGIFRCWEGNLETSIVLEYHFISIMGEIPTYICLFMESEEYEKIHGMRPVHMVSHAGSRTYPAEQANRVVGAGYIATTSRQAKMWLASL